MFAIEHTITQSIASSFTTHHRAHRHAAFAIYTRFFLNVKSVLIYSVSQHNVDDFDRVSMNSPIKLEKKTEKQKNQISRVRPFVFS